MKHNMIFIFVSLFSCGILHSEVVDLEEVNMIYINNLQCEYLKGPLGIETRQPRLSWVLKSDQRGQKQTAYRILVASKIELLEKNQGNLWDSGKIPSDQSIHIEYNGKPLESKQQYYWKVQVWDKDDNPSEWSEPATWAMGLFKVSDWGDAKWISYHDPSQPAPKKRHFGYQSWVSKSADTKKWVAIDLGKTQKIDSVQLFPVTPYGEFKDSMFYYKNGWRPDKPYSTYGWQPDKPGYLFPLRFRIEAADNKDFSDAVTVVDRSEVDIPNPGDEILTYWFNPVSARYVRLVTTRLASREGSNFGFALAEMKVYTNGQNVAKYCSVTALDSVVSSGWSPGRLVDGSLRGELGAIDSFERPTTMVRKEFNLQKPVKRAIAYVTGLGLYELHINGLRVGEHILAPEWTNYRKRIQYQTYDVTNLLKDGKNAIGGQISDGWWSGPLTIESPLENPQFCLLMRLEVELVDDTNQIIVTDTSWQATNMGPIRRADIYYGEKYDALREMPGWDMPGFNSENWLPVKVLEYPDRARDALLVAQCNEPIRVVEELQPVSLTEPEPGVYVFDMGQNMVGWCSLTADAPPGTKITLRYAERVNSDGTLYTDNLRGAAQINEYVWGGGKTTKEPHFTYHGFRYVEVTGLPGKPDKDAIVGKVFHSSAPVTGNFECSNELVNSIMHNIKWGQKGNMQSVPTDCPQRTERFGFLGDMQAFSQTAVFNMDMAAFFTKWVPDIYDSQTEEGCIPNLAPHPAEMDWLLFKNTEFAPGWSDAGVIIPWRMYENYADIRILRQHYERAKKWVEFIHRYNPDCIWRNNHGQDCSDWLNGDMTDLKDYPRGVSTTPHDVFATVFFAHSTEIVSKMAKVLGKEEDASKYRELFKKIKSAFNREFVSSDGQIKGNTQGGYALALSFDLVDEPTRTKMTAHLMDAIERYNNHLSTGFMATHRLMLELSANGQHDEAWRLINLRTVPSWGYMVEMGATTIWERWDGYAEGRGYQHWRMNSFNHFAFGSVGEWIWRNLVGLNPVEKHAGYKHFIIRPRLSDGLTWVKGRYESIYGTIECNWRVDQGRFYLDLTVPPNTTATVYLPVEEASTVLDNGQPVKESPDIKFKGIEDKYSVLDVTSGIYSFSTNIK